MDFPAITAAAALALDADHQVLDVLAFGDLLFSCVSGDHRVYFGSNIKLDLDVTRSRPTLNPNTVDRYQLRRH